MLKSAKQLRFDHEWRMTLLTVLLLPFLLLLGFWQLERAEEKSALAMKWDQRSNEAPRDLIGLDWQAAEALAYTPVKLTGRYLPGKYYLLDNRIHGGRFGYEVLALFEVRDTDLTVLVNRGWIEGDSARQSLPAVSEVSGELSIFGHVYVAPGKPYLLQEQTVEPEWPLRIQAVEMDRLTSVIEKATGGSVFPFPVRIDHGEPGALAVDWQIVNVSPEKHRAYAVQWFSMALALGLFYVLRSSNLWDLLAGRRGKLE